MVNGLFGDPGDFVGPGWAMIVLTPPVLLCLIALPVGRLVLRSWNRAGDSRYEQMSAKMEADDEAEAAALAAARAKRSE